MWRITWPNGAAQFQAEFDQSNAQGTIELLKADRTLRANQRLQTSCPFLFAWNGKEMKFVTDCTSSPLGLKINAQDTLGVMQTEDWIRFAATSSSRATASTICESPPNCGNALFDHVSLMAVDHPAGTDIWVDERLAVPQLPLAVYGNTPPRPVTRAWDEKKRDVSAICAPAMAAIQQLRARRISYLARDHWVEVELGDEVPRDKSPAMANGWIRPTNSSINGPRWDRAGDKPRGLSLEVPDGKGRLERRGPARSRKAKSKPFSSVWTAYSHRVSRVAFVFAINLRFTGLGDGGPKNSRRRRRCIP